MRIPLGFEVPDGTEFDADVEHLAIYGLTRRSGKTTALEGLMSRLPSPGPAALVLRTGRNEIPFATAQRVRPFFRERYDWKYVEALLQTFLGERTKIYRTWLMRTTEGAASLADVHRRILREAPKARGGWNRDVLFQLDRYFREIVPALHELNPATELPIDPGTHYVMDLEGIALSVQQLVVGSVLDRLMDRPPAGGCVVVLPEARDFLPSDRSTPAKLSADQFVRRGAKIGLWLWIDSQSLTGVDQQLLRNVSVTLHGRQTSDLEVRRVVKALDRAVKPADVRNLGLGQFIVETDHQVRTVYVQPAWLDGAEARAIARGKIKVTSARAPPAPVAPVKQEEDVEDKEREQFEEQIRALEDANAKQAAIIADLQRGLAEERQRGEASMGAPVRTRASSSPNEIIGGPGEAEGNGGERIDLHVRRELPSLTVHERIVHVEAHDQDLRGRLALLLADGKLDHWTKQVDVAKELAARGAPDYRSNGGQRARLLAELVWFTQAGFLRRSGPTYQAISEAKSRVRRLREEAHA